MSAPASAAPGTAFNVTVTALDASSNIATSYLGTVHFTSNDGAAVLPANYTFGPGDAGAHTFSVVLNSAGNRTVTAIDTASSAITGTGNISVSTRATTISVASSVNPSSTGQSVTFTATVTASGGTPTGTVTFKDGATTLGAPVTLSGGIATFSTTTLTSGVHSITADYGGDPNFTGSTSSALTQNVNVAPSTTTLTSPANPSRVGQSVTFTATVTGTSGTPTGTVTFKDGATALGAPVTLAGGIATFSTTALTGGAHSITAVYAGDTNFTGSTSSALTQNVNVTSSTATLTSSANPSKAGQSVTFTATVTGASGTPTGMVTFKDGATTIGGPVPLSGGAATFSTNALSAGTHAVTAVYSGDGSYTGSTSAAVSQVVQGATTTTLTSSLNPSPSGQPVTFTAVVTGLGGTPGGTVTFSDGGTAIGTATLSAGVATITTTTLAAGSHSIMASYGGGANFNPSASQALAQTVNTPSDSAKLRELQVNVTKVVAQASGQAISGAIDSAISDGFNDNGGNFATPGPSGMRFNFAADGNDVGEAGVNPAQSRSAYSASGDLAGTGNGRTGQTGSRRVDDAFAAIDQQMPRKAPTKNFREDKDWLFWVDVRGSGIDRLTSTTTAAGTTTAAAPLYGQQINALAGLTYRMRPDFLVGVVGGYENFSYTEQDINGKLTGDGWTIGSYLGWKITPTLRYDAAVTYSGIGYNSVAGTAQGNFSGDRWMVATGLTGTYKAWGFAFEPSAKVYALWENEGAYVDSLGTQQASRRFSSGRASAGMKAIYPFAWTDTVSLAPYLGIYGDYYFNQDNAAAIVAAGGVPLASTPLLDGWSARVTAGLGAKFEGGAALGVGAEYGGIGANFQTWTFKARGQVPFSAQ
ncbi:Ig-like domain repeat protein [Bradyrhizobium septentrionale]|uniref:Ig-like domain repeat protein n=1 Tax=Bradyrhizobium septentrionale TaxID=1404411 RepID=A0ABZ2P6Y3_9BRAD